MEKEDEKTKQAEWKYQKEFPIQGRMREVIKLTIEATKAELEKNRKKLRKLQYGS
jgi:hypothetical protein